MTRYWTFVKGQTKQGYEGTAVILADSSDRAWQMLYYTLRVDPPGPPSFDVDPVASDAAQKSLEADGWQASFGGNSGPTMDTAIVMTTAGVGQKHMNKDLG